MLERKHYRAFNLVLSIFCGFIERVTGYTQALNITRAHAIYVSLMSRVVSGRWRQARTIEELKLFGFKECEFKKEFAEFFSSVYTSGVYIISFHFPDHLLEDTRRFGDASVLDASVYEQYDGHIKKVYRRSSNRQATGVQYKVM